MTRYPTSREDALFRKELSAKEAEGLKTRTIPCPDCGYKLAVVCEDACSGHIIRYCRKCKREVPINLAYFRTHKIYHPKGSKNPLELMNEDQR